MVFRDHDLDHGVLIASGLAVVVKPFPWIEREENIVWDKIFHEFMLITSKSVSGLQGFFVYHRRSYMHTSFFHFKNLSSQKQ